MAGFRTIAVILALLLMTVVPLPVCSQATPQSGLALLDVERVRQNSAAVRSIRAQLETYMEAFRADTKNEEDEMRAAQEELAGKRPDLLPEAYAQERRKLEQRLSAAQTKVEDRRRSLEHVHMEAMQKVQDALAEIVKQVAIERNVGLVLRKDQTVFSEKSMEITDEVLLRLDQSLPEVKLPDPGTSAKQN